MVALKWPFVLFVDRLDCQPALVAQGVDICAPAGAGLINRRAAQRPGTNKTFQGPAVAALHCDFGDCAVAIVNGETGFGPAFMRHCSMPFVAARAAMRYCRGILLPPKRIEPLPVPGGGFRLSGGAA